jgi:hypothetical protein
MFAILIRFSEPRWLEAFRNEGELFMNTLDYFRTLESDPARADTYEGTGRMVQPADIGELIFDSGLPQLGKHIADPRELCGPVRVSLSKTLACNIFCMFSITRPIDGDIVKAEHRHELGSAFVLVLNSAEFMNRVIEAGRREGLAELSCGAVEYYDGTLYSGEVGPFGKRSIYRHQSEYRIVAKPGLGRPRTLRVGNLRDITSEILPSADINELLDFSSNSAREAGLVFA